MVQMARFSVKKMAAQLIEDGFDEDEITLASNDKIKEWYEGEYGNSAPGADLHNVDYSEGF
jgi:hypothetical protein